MNDFKPKPHGQLAMQEPKTVAVEDAPKLVTGFLKEASEEGLDGFERIEVVVERYKFIAYPKQK